MLLHLRPGKPRDLHGNLQKAALSFGLAVTALILWLCFKDNLWSPDTINQYKQAVSGVYVIEHPPLMAAVWSLLLSLSPKESIIPIQIATYTAAIALLLLFAPTRTPSGLRILLSAALVFSPPCIAFLGVIWKDTHMAVSWVAASSLMLVGFWNPRLRTAMTAVAVTFVIYGTLVRHNGFLAAPPLLLLAISQRSKIKNIPVTLSLYASCAVLMFLTASIVNSHVLRASESKYGRWSLPAFDMAGITARTGHNAFPVPLDEGQLEQITQCYNPDRWDPLYFNNSPCRWLVDALRIREQNGSSTYVDWLQSIAQDPLPYVQHRLSFANKFYCIDDCFQSRYVYRAHSDIAEDADVRAVAVRLYVRLMDRAYLLNMLRPVLAGVLAVIVFGFSMRIKIPESPHIQAFCICSILNLLSHLPFGVASDQRYAYPSFLLVFFAAATMLLLAPSPRSGFIQRVSAAIGDRSPPDRHR